MNANDVLPDAIFVFGSNLAGVHGAGAAKWAFENRGAVWGKGEGLYGQSYALPTKDMMIRTMPINSIRMHVEIFKDFARSRPDLTFQLTPVGCGLAGLSPAAIGPMFKGAPENVIIPVEFEDYV